MGCHISGTERNNSTKYRMLYFFRDYKKSVNFDYNFGQKWFY